MVIDKLGSTQLNYSEKRNLIEQSVRSPAPLRAAGVILPLFYSTGEFFFRLCKRSRLIPQAGDLSCPGGILHEWQDRIIMSLVNGGVIPAMRNRAGILSRRRDAETFQTICLFLANAIREAWEEIRLNPFSVHFLGPLPAYALQHFRRIIFPMVCLSPAGLHFHPNYEVESVVDIPVSFFFDQENYATLVCEIDGTADSETTEPRSMPCLIYQDQTGMEHILWGATFLIIISFLEIIFNFQLPDCRNKRFVRKTINERYLAGEGKNR